jgi:hypothetical protein
MFGILHPQQDRPSAPPVRPEGDLEAVTVAFLRQAQRAALARFTPHSRWSRGCHTAQLAVEQRPGDSSTGAIVAYVSADLVQAWSAAAPGSARERKAHVMDQLRLVLQDLRDQQAHAALAFSSTQCEVYDLDLAQLVAESLQRTTFAALRRDCGIHWEGTLVRSLRPPAFVLALSIGLPSARPSP